MDKDKKNIIVRVSTEYHQNLKIYLAQKGLTMQEYVLGLIESDISSNKGGK